MASYDWTGNPITQGNTVGDTTTTTTPTMGGSIGDFFSNISSGNWGNALNTIGSVLSGSAGTGSQIAGVAGLSYLLNQLTGGGGTPYRGYTGGIPTYSATREQTPYSTQTMTTAEGKVVPRRPGSGGITYFKPTTYTKAADGGLMQGYPTEPVLRMAEGGISSLGGYSDGGQLLKGPGDGVSDSIPASIGGRQPARLADGEFVIPARIVSELGNGSTEAGARKLYAMMDRIQKQRKKTVGKNKIAVNSKSDKHLPA